MATADSKPMTKFESFLFSVTRIFALCGSVAVILGIAFLAFKLIASGGTSSISYAEVAKMMTPATNATGTSPAVEESNAVAIPDEPDW